MKVYLISSLTFRFANADLVGFSKTHPYDWLVWEVGGWKAPASTTLVGQGLEKSTPTPVKPAGEPVALALEPKKDGGQLTLGRGAECDAVIADGTLSQLHLVLMQDKTGAWTVRDAGSRNGSTIDGVKLEPGQPQVLKTGCRLTAAGVAFTYYGPQGMLQRLKL